MLKLKFNKNKLRFLVVDKKMAGYPAILMISQLNEVI